MLLRLSSIRMTGPAHCARRHCWCQRYGVVGTPPKIMHVYVVPRLSSAISLRTVQLKVVSLQHMIATFKPRELYYSKVQSVVRIIQVLSVYNAYISWPDELVTYAVWSRLGWTLIAPLSCDNGE